MVALLLQAAVPQPAPAPVPDEVTVIGHKLKKWAGKVSTTFGITTCRTTRSTGDREIDAVGCTALRACWPQYLPRFKAAEDGHLAADERKRLTDAATADLRPCLLTRRDALIEELAVKRAAMRERRS